MVHFSSLRALLVLTALLLLGLTSAQTATAAEVKFASPVEFPAGITPVGTAAADFDEDGNTDLMVVSQGENSLSLLLGDGAGGFAAQTKIPTDYTYGITTILTADFDADGHVDLLLNNYGTLTVLLGDGAGGFTASHTAYVPGNDIHVGDFNADGIPDILAAGQNVLSVTTGDGAGSFAAPVTSTGVFDGTVTTGDFNGDGFLDVAAARNAENVLRVFNGSGTGVFALTATYEVNPGVRDVAAADLTGDGRPEITVLADPGFGHLAVLLNDGTGGFASRVDIEDAYAVGQIQFADVDGDGNLDLLASIFGDQVGVMLGTGSAIAPLGALTTFSPGSFGLTTADFNEDGLLDLAWTRPSANKVVVRLGKESTAPVAVDDTFTVDEDSEGTDLPVLDNDTDADGDPLAFEYEIGAQPSDPAHGFLSDETWYGGGLVYYPDADYCTAPGADPDTFTYTLPGGDTATVSITVTCVVDPVSAQTDEITVAEDSSPTVVDVLANDPNPDAVDVAVVDVSDPENGTATLVDGVVTYTPDPNYCSPFYEYDDGDGGTYIYYERDYFVYSLDNEDAAGVYVTVTCVDDPATAVNDALSLTEDDPASLSVLDNDTNPDGLDLSITDLSDPAHGDVENYGSELYYVPESNYCTAPGADPETFTYTITGGTTATVSFTIECVDDLAVAVNDTNSVDEDTPTSLDVLANDSDAEGDAISITGVSYASHGEVTIDNSGATDRLLYTPDAGFCTKPNRAPDSITYTVTDGATANVLLSITCIDDAPVAADDDADVDQGSVARKLDVLGNDSDEEGDPIEILSVTQPSHGTAAIVQGSPDRVSYKPDAGYCNDEAAPDTFAYTVTGGDTATVEVSVACVTPPAGVVPPTATAVADAPTVGEDAGTTPFSVLDNDTQPAGSVVEIVAISNPAHGTATLVNGDPDKIAYTPDGDHCGTDSFTYTVSGGSATTVSVSVTCVDDAPAPKADLESVDEDAPARRLNVLANDTDAEGNPIEITAVSKPAHGTTAIVDGTPDRVSYKPDANYCNDPGSAPDTFTYTVTGGATATVSVEVVCLDEPAAPVAATPAPVTPAPVTPVAPAAATPTVSPSPLACTSRSVILLDVVKTSKGIRVAGLARPALRGQTVTITELPSGEEAGTATVKPDGSFSTTVPAPSATLAKTVRYRATVGTASSATLKLARRVTITSRRFSPSGTRITGRLADPQRGRTVTITRQVTCAKSTAVTRITAGRDGRFTVVLPAPSSAEGLAYYRANVVRGTSKSFSLPVAVRAG